MLTGMFTQYDSTSYTLLPGTLPCPYGDSIKAIFHRTLYVLTGQAPPRVDEQIKQWKSNAIKGDVLKAIKANPKKIIINLPFQNITLNDAIKRGYVQNNEFGITIPEYKIEHFNSTLLRKNFPREMLLMFSIVSAKILIDFFKAKHSIYAVLVGAIFLGFIKGTAKSVWDIFSSEKASYLWKTLYSRFRLEILAEIVTALTVYTITTQLNLYPMVQSTLRGVYRYFLKHFFQGTLLVLATWTELSIETFKPGLKSCLRAFLRFILLNNGVPYAHFLGPVVGSIFGALLIDIFIDQCFLVSER